jgi:methylmalonyl-CoA/ethylmalonyl-CoA epimerase
MFGATAEPANGVDRAMQTDLGNIMQHGYVVNDAEDSAVEWVERVGAGPFYLIEHVIMDEYYYRGIRTNAPLRIAIGYWGAIQIELIQPIDAADSLYSRAIQSEAGMLNHCATTVSDIDALLAKRRLHDRVLQAGRMPDGLKFVYLDEYLPGGYHLELIQPPLTTVKAFAGMEIAARKWDGGNPLRPISALADDVAMAVGHATPNTFRS